MMKCETCGHEQESGKFCGKCGNALVASTAPTQEPNFQNPSTAGTIPQAAAPGYQGQADPRVNVEKVKSTSKVYWNYFIEYLKNPSKVLIETDKNFGNALITFAIFALVSSFAVLNMINYMIGPVDEFASLVGASPSLFQVLLNTTIILALIIAISLGSLFIITKFFGPQTAIKSLITMYGTYLLPAAVILIASYLLLSIDSRGFGTALFFLALFFSFFIMPLFLVTSLINQNPQKLDGFYGFISYIAVFFIGLLIAFLVFADSTFGKFFALFGEFL